jgi:hypothetical protein
MIGWRRALVAGLVFVALFVAAVVLGFRLKAEAYTPGWWKWKYPFEHDEEAYITQGYDQGTHTGASAKALDFDIAIGGVYSYQGWVDASAEGQVVEAVGNQVCNPEQQGSGFGNRVKLRLTDLDGTQYDALYGHLYQPLLVTLNQLLLQGDLIAKEGDTGYVLNQQGQHQCGIYHLHFQVNETSSGAAEKPEPMSGDTGLATGQQPYSNNARIGYSASGGLYGGIRRGYDEADGTADTRGWGTVGSSGQLPSSSSYPCARAPTYYAHTCSDGDSSGWVQSFNGVEPYSCGVIMTKSPTTAGPGYHVYGGILEAYSQIWNGQQWVKWMGYPTCNRTGGSQFFQKSDSERGYIQKSGCTEHMYLWNPNGGKGGLGAWELKTTYDFCD